MGRGNLKTTFRYPDRKCLEQKLKNVKSILKPASIMAAISLNRLNRLYLGNMRSTFKKGMIVTAAVFIIAALGLLQFNKTANLHYHIDGYGLVVSHSHPYDKSNDAEPYKTHPHGRFDLTIMSGSVDMSVAEWPHPQVKAPSSDPIQFYSCLVSGEQDVLHPISGRAPPFITI